jgi:hypothetical protein
MFAKRRSTDGESRRASLRRPVRRPVRKTRAVAQRPGYGPVFFVVLGVTLASLLGLMGVVASVMAGS